MWALLFLYHEVLAHFGRVYVLDALTGKYPEAERE
jgi:hypothetical protein